MFGQYAIVWVGADEVPQLKLERFPFPNRATSRIFPSLRVNNHERNAAGDF
jgi:hypothetical protein